MTEVHFNELVEAELDGYVQGLETFRDVLHQRHIELRDHLTSCDRIMGDTHACTCGMDKYRKLLEELSDKSAAYRSDAERYRWLRKHGWIQSGPTPCLWFGAGARQTKPETVDAAVDQQMDFWSANGRSKYVGNVVPSLDTHCRWTQDGEGGAWDTQCRHRFEFTHDLEHDDAITFCMYCGKPMDVYPYEEPPNDEA